MDARSGRHRGRTEGAELQAPGALLRGHCGPVAGASPSSPRGRARGALVREAGAGAPEPDPAVAEAAALRPRPKRKSRPGDAGPPSVARRGDSRRTVPPLRFRMVSADALCIRSMEIEWENGTGQRQSWSSWTDWLCGWYEAEKVLPCSATDIRVFFKVRTLTGPVDVCRVERSDGCCWVRGSDGKCAREEVWLRIDPASLEQSIDAVFEMTGPMLHCYVSRAWNAGHDCDAECSKGAARKGPRAAWEWWQAPPERPLPTPRPKALDAADTAAAPSAGAGDPVKYYESATHRLAAAAKELQDIRRASLALVRALDQRQTAQWVAVNSTNTLSAGLSIASAVSMFLVPPVGIALGISSAAVGGAATAGDTIADRLQFKELREQMSAETWNTLAVAELEREWLQARDAASEALQAAGGGSLAKQLEEAGVVGAAVAKVGAVVAKVVIDAVDGSSSGGSAAAAGLSVAKAAPRVLGVASAVLSAGIAIHGWSTTKSFQVSVQEKAEALESALLHTQRWLSGVGELECSICLCAVALGDATRRCRTWHYSHARCYQQWEETCRASRRMPVCPLCNGEMTSEERTLEEFLTEDIQSNLRESKA